MNGRTVLPAIIAVLALLASPAAQPLDYRVEKREIERNRHGKISIQLPVIKGLANRAFQERTNAALAEMLHRDAAQFEKMYKEYPRDAVVSREHLQLNWTFKAIRSGEGRLCLRMFRYAYAGGAHGNHLVLTRNYDMKNGREIKLADIFRPDSKWLARLSELSRKHLGARVVWSEGIDPKPENFQAFLITREGLGLVFQNYQIAPYAAGISEIVIPWSELKSITAGAPTK